MRNPSTLLSGTSALKGRFQWKVGSLERSRVFQVLDNDIGNKHPARLLDMEENQTPILHSQLLHLYLQAAARQAQPFGGPCHVAVGLRERLGDRRSDPSARARNKYIHGKSDQLARQNKHGNEHRQIEDFENVLGFHVDRTNASRNLVW